MSAPAAARPAGAAAAQAPPAPAQGAWLEVWIPCVVFAHVFASIWLISAYLKMNPGVAARLRSALAAPRRWLERCRGPRGGRGEAAGSSGEEEESSANEKDLKQLLAAGGMAGSRGGAGRGEERAAARARAPAGVGEAGAPPAAGPAAAAAAEVAAAAAERRPWAPPLPPIPSPSASPSPSLATPLPPFLPDGGSGGGGKGDGGGGGKVNRRWTATGSPAADALATAIAAAAGFPKAPTSKGPSQAQDADGPPTPPKSPTANTALAPAHTFPTRRTLTATSPRACSSAAYLRAANGSFGRSSRHVHSLAAAESVAAAAAAVAAVAPDIQVVRRVSTGLRRISIEWKDLGCSYETAHGPRVVLQGVYGRAAPGDLLGLMGPSGAGKSTLLDVLAARKSVGSLTGQVLVDGRPRVDAAFVHRSAYVPQDDHFIPTLTANEALAFHAALVLPAATSAAARRARCAEVLLAMGLGRQGGTLVGGTLPGGLSLRGLSGGERKRLAIATGIVAAPSCLLLDEPTSGLDASAALGVMSYMRALADAGHVVLASVHQPRQAIWAMFTQVSILSCGRMMYSGDRAGAVPWFTTGLGYSYDPARHGVASDWIMDLVNTGFKKPRRLYGRMMTTSADVAAAADAYLPHYLAAAAAGPRPHPAWLAAPPNAADADAAVGGPDGAAAPATLAEADLEPLGSAAGSLSFAASGGVGIGSGGAAAAGADSPASSAHRRFWDTTGASLIAHRGSHETGSSVVGPTLGPRGPGMAAPLPPPPGASSGGGAGTDSDGGGVSGPFARNRSAFAMVPPPGGGGGGGGPGSLSASAGSPPLLPGTPLTTPTPSGGGALPPTAAAAPAAAASGAAGGAAMPAKHRRSILRKGGSGGGRRAGGAGGGGGAPAGVSFDLAAAEAAVAAAAKRSGRKAAVEVRPLRKPGWFRQVQVLTWREVLSVTRNPADVAGRMLIFCWVAIVVGLIFYSLGDYFESMRNRTDVLFIESCILMLLPYVYMSLYTADKQYYTADLSAKLYRPSAYYVAKLLAVLPFSILSMLVYSFTIYGMAGLRHDAGALWQHGLLATLAYLCASQVLYAAAIATPNQDAAFMVAIAWTAVNILMSNYLIIYPDMDQVWLSWGLRWFSAMAWTFQGFVGAELHGRDQSCAGGFGTDILSALPAYLPGNPALHPTNFLARLLANPGPDCRVDTSAVLSYFGMRLQFWQLTCIMLGYLAALHVITFVALKLTAGRERR
ncbi:hypothetical protein HYH03_002785 [Edaphochlamys debaryana]|uniref:ABC transporter domain-containing protein n=1 Tax=Edaphochlamys debaryana TaxID=47281 RepID=A0A835YK82_9CHLO|nr:hypothetical protein HYH03_002785 [Edaphochlamys debaryana]|eukprot:KAG2499204.1 hypothetical protein HYH03_002785 [Edaphochlamys debaryana]